MEKTLKDLKIDPNAEKINLGANFQNKKNKPLRDQKIKKRNKNIIYKEQKEIQQIQDLHFGDKPNYIYIKGKSFNPPKSLGNILKIGISGFIILILINMVSVYYTGKKLEKNISAQAYEGYMFLLDAGKQATKIQFDDALSTFDKALSNFSEAEENLWFISTDKTFYADESNINNAAKALLTGGKYFAVSGKYFLEAMEEFNKIPLYFVSKNKNKTSNSVSITDTIQSGLEKTNLAIEEISLAADKITNIDEKSLPVEIRARTAFAKKKVAEVSDLLNATAKHFPAILKLLGNKKPHRYLILLQNNNEIRPSGGFIGSYVIMDINEGYIEKLEVKDVYDIDGAYKGVIEPPEEIKLFTPNWRFRDSNYSSDFSISGNKAKWFLQEEGGETVDTVIAINQGLLRDMLEITGPIQVGNFGKLNSENYNLLLSYIIEGKIWGADDPKHILKVFVPAFKEAILKEENISKVASKLYRAIQQKHILMYSSDEEIQDLFETFGISGKAYENSEDEDYLSVINISVGWNKSDQFIEENITHDTYVDKNGGLTDEITIKRTHLWNDNIYKRWKNILNEYGFYEIQDSLIDILGRGNNKVLTRIYVPAGSILLESNGSDIQTKYDSELKKTYFFLTTETMSQKKSEIKIKYRLPFELGLNETPDTYKLIIEKQPGSRGSIFTKTLHLSEEVEIMSVYPEEALTEDDSNVTFATNLVYDKYFSSALFSSKHFFQFIQR